MLAHAIGVRLLTQKEIELLETRIRGATGEKTVKLAFSIFQKTTVGAQHLLYEAEKTGLVFKDLVQSVDRLAAKFESKGSKEPSRPFDIKDYTETITRLQDTVQKINELIITTDTTSFPLFAKAVDQLNDTAEKRVDHVFLRLVQLFAIISVMVLIIVVVNNLLRRREAGRPN